MEETKTSSHKKSHEEVLTEIGGFSRLAFRACFILIPAKVSGDLIVILAAFYQLMPKFECKQADSNAWQTCTQKDFCENMGAPAGVEYRENLSDPETLQNWVQQLSMQCSPKSEFGFLGTIIFLGWTISALITSRSSDLYGRKWVLIIIMVLQFAAITVMCLAKNYLTMATALFIMGACSSVRWTVAYVYLMEFLTEANIKLMGPVFNASAAVAFVIGAFTLQFLSKDTVVL